MLQSIVSQVFVVQGETWIETLHMLVKVSSRKRIGFHEQKARSWKQFIDSSM